MQHTQPLPCKAQTRSPKHATAQKLRVLQLSCHRVQRAETRPHKLGSAFADQELEHTSEFATHNELWRCCSSARTATLHKPSSLVSYIPGNAAPRQQVQDCSYLTLSKVSCAKGDRERRIMRQ